YLVALASLPLQTLFLALFHIPRLLPYLSHHSYDFLHTASRAAGLSILPHDPSLQILYPSDSNFHMIPSLSYKAPTLSQIFQALLDSTASLLLLYDACLILSIEIHSLPNLSLIV